MKIGCGPMGLSWASAVARLGRAIYGLTPRSTGPLAGGASPCPLLADSAHRRTSASDPKRTCVLGDLLDPFRARRVASLGSLSVDEVIQ
jgi:hypothetical protein